MTVQDFIDAWDPQREIDKAITWDISDEDLVQEASLIVSGAADLGETVSYDDAAAYIEGVKDRLLDEFIQGTEEAAKDNIYVARNAKIRVEVPYIELGGEVDRAISIAYHDRGGNSWETILRGLVLSTATAAWADSEPCGSLRHRVTPAGWRLEVLGE